MESSLPPVATRRLKLSALYFRYRQRTFAVKNQWLAPAPTVAGDLVTSAKPRSRYGLGFTLAGKETETKLMKGVKQPRRLFAKQIIKHFLIVGGLRFFFGRKNTQLGAVNTNRGLHVAPSGNFSELAY